VILVVKHRNKTKKQKTIVCGVHCIVAPLGASPLLGRAARRVTPHLRFSRYAPSALRAQLPLLHCLQKTKTQTMRQSGFARPETVADANRWPKLPHPKKAYSTQ
jgi:hypothetical protein